MPQVEAQPPADWFAQNVPFQPGQRVEVVLIAEEERPAARIQELRALFKATQALPEARAISDEEIAAEIAAYRAGG